MKMQVLDLFSGIGGFSLGLESTGLFETVAFCEKEEFPKRVLKKHWPHLPIHEDVHHVSGYAYRGIDLIAGGFPCQPVSVAGARKGKEDERWLWPQFHRIIEEARPRWCLIENVPGLRTRHADDVLGDLEESGYTCWPLVVGAVHAGAPHQRKRVWIVAHDMLSGLRSSERGERRVVGVLSGNQRLSKTASPNRQGQRRQNERKRGQQEKPGAGSDGQGGDVANSQCHDLWQKQRRAEPERSRATEPGDDGQGGEAAHAARELPYGSGQKRRRRPELANGGEQWNWHRAPEPVLRGVDDGLPCGMDRRERLTALGNAVVPQIVAALGQAIWWMDVIQ